MRADLSSQVRDNMRRSIECARTSDQLHYTVVAYLSDLGETIRANDESYGAIAARLGSDELLKAAERKKRELDDRRVAWAANFERGR